MRNGSVFDKVVLDAIRLRNVSSARTLRLMFGLNEGSRRLFINSLRKGKKLSEKKLISLMRELEFRDRNEKIRRHN